MRLCIIFSEHHGCSHKVSVMWMRFDMSDAFHSKCEIIIIFIGA
jgi:hypothetical protein